MLSSMRALFVRRIAVVATIAFAAPLAAQNNNAATANGAQQGWNPQQILRRRRRDHVLVRR